MAPAISITSIGPLTYRQGSRARTARRSRAGFTLAEAMIASIVLAVATIGISSSIGASYQQDQSVQQMSTAIALNRQLMEEISAKPFDDPNGTSALGPETGESTRSLYDNVDDYNGYSEGLGALVDRNGTLYPTNDQQFTRAVVVASVTQTVTNLGGDIPGLTVTITLTHRSGEVWTFARFIPKPAH